MSEKTENLPLASEMYADLKDTNRFLRRLLVATISIILVLIVAFCGTNLYHIYKWSQFETVVVDSESGPANYVQGDNGGGIYNGPGYSTPEENGPSERSPDQEDQQP